MPSNLEKILSAYGFEGAYRYDFFTFSGTKQVDIIRLLKLTGALESTRLEEDLRKTGHNELEIQQILALVRGEFNPEAILKQWPSYNSVGEWSQKTHNWLIKMTQRELFARKPGEERWQMPTGAWIENADNKEAIQAIISNLELRNEVRPKNLKPDVVCVLGATTTSVRFRMNYAKILIDSAKEDERVCPTILCSLSGERVATKEVDGGEAYVKLVAEKNHIALEEVTEGHLMDDVYRSMRGEINKQSPFSMLPYQNIYTPKPTGKARPDAIDTSTELCRQIKNKKIKNKHNEAIEIKSILFISSAPHIKTHEESLRTVFKEHLPEVQFEVVGSGNLLESAKTVMSSLGGALFGGYVRVAHALGSQKSVAELEAIRKTLSFGANVVKTDPAQVSTSNLATRLDAVTSKVPVAQSTQIWTSAIRFTPYLYRPIFVQNLPSTLREKKHLLEVKKTSCN